MILQGARAIEDVFDKTGGNSLGGAEALRQVEYQTVGGLGRRRERVLGAFALLFGDLPLFEGDAPLPIGQAGKRERDHETGGEAAGEDVTPPGGAASAFGDEGSRLLGRRRRAARARSNPALGLLQSRRTQQQTAGAVGPRPVPRQLAEFGVLPDPGDVGLQRLGKLIGARFEAVRIIEENKIQPPQRLGRRVVLDTSAHDRRKTLVERGGVGDLLECHVRRHRVGREHEHDGIGAEISASMRFHQSSKA